MGTRKRHEPKKISRRSLLEKSLWTLPSYKLALGSGALGFHFIPGVVSAQSSNKRKLIQIFLDGGWDSMLATDPVLSGSSKASSSGYDDGYKNATYYGQQVSGKANLHYGYGLAPAASAMQNFNCAFVNGIFVEVTAHELAQMYLLSGKMTLSRSREYASFIAKMGEASGLSTSHVVLGQPIPLAETAQTAPPIFSTNASDLAGMISGPSSPWVSSASVERAHELISSLNALRNEGLTSSVSASEGDWRASEQALSQLYASPVDYASLLTLDASESSAYGTPVSGSTITDYRSEGALLHLSLKVLSSSLSPYVTVRIGGYDTHENHFGRHDVTMRSMSTALNQLMIDLAATDDPTDSGKKLIDNTTVLVYSEFNRTPKLNQASGTDHWKTASAMLLGAGVSDNTVIGATDDGANALGWTGASSAPITDQNVLLCEHLMATLCAYFGYADLADELSSTRITGLIG